MKLRVDKERLVLIFFILLALVILWPLVLHPNWVPFQPRQNFSDLLISHLPNAIYIRDSLARYAQLPLWNTQIMSGQPFAADPLASLWYPPAWLLVVLPLPFAFNLLFILHYAWAGYGLYRFVRLEGLEAGPALFAGLSFACMPKLMAHLGAGHASLVYAVCWTPWMLYTINLAITRQNRRYAALAGACLALIFLADVRWVFYSGLLGLAYGWLTLRGAGTRQRAAAPNSLRSQAGLLIIFGLIFLTLIGILALPLGEFLLVSNRSALSLQDSATYSMPPLYFIGLIIPDPYGFHEWMTYLGFLPLCLALIGLFPISKNQSNRDEHPGDKYRSDKYRSDEHRSDPLPNSRQRFFWLLIIVVAAAFSLGVNFFLYPLLFRLLPGLSFLRVPPRALFLVAIGVDILAAYGLQTLLTILRMQGKPAALTPIIIFGACLFTLVDLMRVDAALMQPRPLPEKSPATEWIEKQSGLFRVYSPSYSLPFPDRLQHADGIDPMHLSGYAEFIGRASGLPVTHYSVTVPSFINNGLDKQASMPGADLFGWLNVKYLVAGFPLYSNGLTLVKTLRDTSEPDKAEEQTFIYKNALFRPRAWLSNNDQELEPEQLDILEWTPNRISVLLRASPDIPDIGSAQGGRLLILSEVAYPGWRAWVNGQPIHVETVRGILRGVRLPVVSLTGEDQREVVFAYRPWSVYIGALMTAIGLILLVFFLRGGLAV